MAMTRWQRKAALRYGQQKEIADALGVSETTVSRVINGHLRDRRVEVAIARKIGKPVDDVFEPIDGKASDDGADSLEHAVGQ